MKPFDFAVMIAVYNNKAAELIEAVFSVSKRNQTIEQNYDIYLIDDGSTNDETIRALTFLEDTLGCKVIRHETNKGASAAFNTGHSMIPNKWIAMNGSTDISFPTRFEMQIRHLQSNPGIDVLGTQLFAYKDSDPYRKPTFTSSHLYTETLERRKEGWLTMHGTAFVLNEAVKSVGGYTKQGRAQDVDLWKRMHKAGKRIHTLNTVQYAWRRDK